MTTTAQPNIPESLINDDFFTQVGVTGLSEQKKSAMVPGLEGRLQLILAEKMAHLLDETQYDSFKDAINTSDQQIVWEWLNLNCPNYDVIAMQARTELIDEIKTRLGDVAGNPA